MRTLEDRITQYENALLKLKEAIEIYNNDNKNIYVDAMIQRFEFTVELAWKMLKEYLIYEKLGEFSSPRSVIKESFKQNMIDNGELWLDIIDDRNLTSHTYDELTANRIKDNIINKYLKEFELLLDTIKDKIK